MILHSDNFPDTSKARSEIVRDSQKPTVRSSSQVALTGPPSGESQQIDLQDGRFAKWKNSKDTFGECLPGLLIETIVDRKHPNRLALCTYDSKLIAKRASVRHRGVEYHPSTVGPGLAHAVGFSPGGRPFASVSKLVAKIDGFLAKYLDQDARTRKLLIAFVFASWFVDCFEIAPVLSLHGPEHEVGTVMRLLNCLTYRPILLSDLDLVALRTLASGLKVTLPVHQHNLKSSVKRALLNSARRHFHLAVGKKLVEIFGARALHCQQSIAQFGVSVFIHPARRTMPGLTDKEERSIFDEFQSMLLAYRLNRHQQVGEFKVPADANCPGFEDQLKTWMAAIAECPAIEQCVRQAFAERREEASSVYYEDPAYLVIEAALLYCHKKDYEQFYVGELAERVNDLLVARHADLRVEDRKVGSVLSDLGIQKRRVTKGFRVDLTAETRQRIHRIAMGYQVLSARTDIKGCAECKTKDLVA